MTARPRAGRSARAGFLLASVVAVALAVGSCVPAPSAPPSAPSTTQPAPAAQRDVTGFVQRPCDLIRPEQLVALGLESPETASDVLYPAEPSACGASRARADAPDDPDDVIWKAQPRRDLVAYSKEITRPVSRLAELEIDGLPAVLVMSPGDFSPCRLSVLTAQGESLEVSMLRYRPVPVSIGDACDIVRSVGEQIVENLPRRTA